MEYRHIDVEQHTGGTRGAKSLHDGISILVHKGDDDAQKGITNDDG